MKKKIFLSKSNKCHEPFADELKNLLKKEHDVYQYNELAINRCDYLIIIPECEENFYVGKGVYTAIEEFKDKDNIFVAINLFNFYKLTSYEIENEHDWSNYATIDYYGEYNLSDIIIRKTMVKETSTLNKLKELGEDNKEALIAVSKVRAGEIALNNAVALLKDKLPGGYGYLIDSTVGKLIVANLVAFAVNSYLPENKKAKVISEALLEGSYATLIDSFNIEELFSSITKGVNFSSLIEE